MKIQFILLVISLSCSTAFSQKPEKPITVGEQFEIYSEQLQENRHLNIYLPLGYSNDSAKTYPVIYLLDGSIHEDFIHISGITQFLSYSWINSMPEVIIVGITNVDRKRDFTFPTTIPQDKVDFPTTGGSEKCIAFLEKELQPAIEKKYKVSSKKVLVGQSLGGLLASEIILTQPKLFTHYLIVSPSLWWDNQSLLSKVNPKELNNLQVLVAVGKEGRVMQRDAKSLYKKLSKSIPKDKIAFQYFKHQDHGDVLHLAAYAGFAHLFSNTNPKTD